MELKSKNNGSKYKYALLNALGMLAVGLAEFFSNTEDAFTILSNLGISQLLFGGYLIQFIICIILWNILKYYDTANELGHWYGNSPYNIYKSCLYGLLKFIDVFCFWYSIRLIPFADHIV